MPALALVMPAAPAALAFAIERVKLALFFGGIPRGFRSESLQNLTEAPAS